MAIAIRGHSIGSGLGNTGGTVTLPVTANAGDLILLHVGVHNAGTTTTVTATAGGSAFHQIEVNGNTTAGGAAMWAGWLIASGGETSVVVTIGGAATGGNNGFEVILCTGHDPTAPVPVSTSGQTTASGTAGPALNLSPSVPGALVYAWDTHNSLGTITVPSTPSGWTVEDSSTAPLDPVAVLWNPSVSSGATGSVSPTSSTSFTGSGAVMYLVAAVGIGPLTGIPSAEAFGTPSVTVGPATVAPAGIASAQTFGTDSLAPGPVAVSPTGIASSEAFGTLDALALVGPTGIASSEAFGSTTINQTVNGQGIASAEAFGAIRGVGALIVPTGIASAEVFGVASAGFVVYPTGIASAEAFGVVAFLAGPVLLSPIGIASAEALGIPALVLTFSPVYAVRAGFGVWYAGTDSDGTYRWGPAETAFGFQSQANAAAQAAAISSRSPGLAAAPIVIFLPGRVDENAPAPYDELIEQGLLVSGAS